MNVNYLTQNRIRTGLILLVFLSLGVAACSREPETESPPPPAESVIFDLPADTLGIVTVEEVVIREEPDTSAAEIGRLNLDDTVTLVSASSDLSWYLVETEDGINGWVFSNFIDRVDETLATQTQESQPSLEVAGVLTDTPTVSSLATPTGRPTVAAMLTQPPSPTVAAVSTLTSTSTLVPVNTPTNTPTVALTTATLALVGTPTSTPTPGSLPGFDLAFASDRSGSFSVHIMNSSNSIEWLELPIPNGYNRAWWPSFCNGWVALEAQDVGGTDPQWNFIIAPNDASIMRIEPSINAQSIGVPRCSPDGALLAQSIKQSGSWGTMTVDNISGDLSRLVYEENSFGFASWTNSQSAFYTMDLESDQWVIYRTQDFQYGEGDRTRIVKDAKYPAVSPDGSNLVYACSDAEKLCLENLQTGDVRVIAVLKYVRVNNQNLPASAMWSADGSWIYYASVDGGDWDIFRIRPDGTGRQNLTEDWTSNEIMPALKW